MKNTFKVFLKKFQRQEPNHNELVKGMTNNYLTLNKEFIEAIKRHSVTAKEAEKRLSYLASGYNIKKGKFELKSNKAY